MAGRPQTRYIHRDIGRGSEFLTRRSVHPSLAPAAARLGHPYEPGQPPGRFANDNGPYQDGALVFEFPSQGQWVAVFLKFQTQAWHYDDTDAHPEPPGPTPTDGDIVPPFDVPDGLVRIVAALVNDTASPERETITLLNTADVAVSLEGWALKDGRKNAMLLSGAIGPGETLRVPVAARWRFPTRAASSRCSTRAASRSTASPTRRSRRASPAARSPSPGERRGGHSRTRRGPACGGTLRSRAGGWRQRASVAAGAGIRRRPGLG